MISPIKRIVVGTDMSAMAARAEARAAMLAHELGCESLDLLHVIDRLALESLRHLAEPLVDTEQHLMDSSRRQLAEVERRLSDSYGIRVMTMTLNVGRAHNEIAHYARLLKAGLVVLGAHGGGLVRELFVGSTVDKVLRTLPCPLLIVRHEPQAPYQRILIAVDFSELSRRALEMARNIAPHASATVLHAFEVPLVTRLQLDPEKIQAYRAELSARKSDEMLELVSSSSNDGVAWNHVVEPGAPADVILKKAQALEADLIIIGKHGEAGWEDMLPGGVTKQVIQYAPCDVLVVEPVEPAGASQ
ncbi:nucleotide-binding universal stress UspA family protein [Nitrosospira sp. Nsp2]|uniref:universal stress protein n=1 Tax=Nitrosospira sp. Nsp2 TaxID=136548 RepID=UPI000D489F6F|nr:universal stress protein [Nitrosospira sp. Nsp2]PTR17384.1 nucleotide-binding universal stress UspA family protein [Nitrosospira sp. Nsp2]